MGIRGNSQADDETDDETAATPSDDTGDDSSSTDAEPDLDYDYDADYDIDKYDTDTTSGQPRSKQRRMERVRTNIQSANIEPGASDFSTKWAIDRLDEREKRFSFAAAGGAILFATILYLAETSNPNFTPSQNQLHPITLLIVGLVAGALLVATTILGRRAPVGFVALFTGAAFSESTFFLGLPFIALALWLLYRSYKIQRQTAANMRAASSGGGASSSPGRGSGRSTSTTAAAVSSAKAARAKGSARPTGNKRYTPKRPPPPPIKPSRKERKAATKSDS